jgi:hypothetical protein
MREFTATLQKIMSVVSNQLELLPASEGAVEEMTIPKEQVGKLGTAHNTHKNE